jgi:hypothetical protein
VDRRLEAIWSRLGVIEAHLTDPRKLPITAEIRGPEAEVFQP